MLEGGTVIVVGNIVCQAESVSQSPVYQCSLHQCLVEQTTQERVPDA
jgi:hypothetical protein